MTESRLKAVSRTLSAASLLFVVAVGALAQSAQPQPEGLKGPSLEGFEKFSPPQIQGAYTFSALTGEIVETSGVVTAIATDNWGFWIQDPKGDGDPATSDGLYIVWGGKPPAPAPPKVGDRVDLIGRVQEPHMGLELPRTQMSILIPVKTVSSGNPLPEPVVLRDLPNLELEEGVGFWEPLEGMRATLQNARVIGPTNRFGEFTVLLAADMAPGSGYYPAKGTLLLRNVGGDKVDYNPERVILDDRILGKLDEVRPGDEVGMVTGVVDYNFGNYKVEAERIEMKTVQPPPKSPFSTLGTPPGNARIADLNMSSFFDEVDDPNRYDENSDPGGPIAIPTHEEVEVRIGKFTRALIDELRLPDIIVIVEFENSELVQRVADKVNAEAGTRYKVLSLPTSDRRGLRVGYIVDEKRVEVVNYYQLKGDDVEAAFGFSSPFRTREPLVGVFRLSPGGPPLTIFALKLKSKRMEPAFPNLNPVQDRFTERQRKMQTTVVRHYINEILAKDPNAWVMASGDCGDFPFPEPGEGVDALSILEGQGDEPKMVNLVKLAEEGTSYTMIFHGNGITLSHMLVSPALRKQFLGIDMLHFNATMPHRYGTVPGTGLRATDRDPFAARFDLRPKKK
ncbi:MAG: hypothetical protein ABUT39_25370 [Acidobacteriota bacterium]